MSAARLKRGLPADPGAAPGAIDEAGAETGLDTAGLDSDDGAMRDRNGLGLVTRVGTELVASVLVGLAIGWGLDSWLKTRPLFLILMVLLGGVAGIVNVWRLVSPDIGKSSPGTGRPPR